MDWKKIISEKSMEIVMGYEQAAGRISEKVHQKGVGYDILSKDSVSERHIEVKATSESWLTYTWLPLYHSEVEALKNNPDKFYLYIVRFEINPKDRNELTLNTTKHELFIINGQDLLNEFNIKPETFSLSPISKSKLKKYLNKKI
jgi:hypothetical protein